MSENVKVVARNKKAYHDFHIDEKYEAGIALMGTEVKSIRNSRINLKEGYIKVENGELILYNVHVSTYEQGNRYNHEPLRPRKLLMHRREINRLFGKVQQKGYTLIPLQAYIKRGMIKIEVGLARGKKKYDKREAEAEKTAKREIEREFKEKQLKWWYDNFPDIRSLP